MTDTHMINNIDSKTERRNFISKFGNIEVPTVLVKSTDSYEKQPWKENPSLINEYFNYGFNEKTWNQYVSKMKEKLNELDNKVKQEKIIIKDDPKVKKYIQNFPLNYGGLGDYTENKDKINYFDSIKKHNPPIIEMKNFTPMVNIPSKEGNLNRGFHLLLHQTDDGVKIKEDKKEKRRDSYDRYSEDSRDDRKKYDREKHKEKSKDRKHKERSSREKDMKRDKYRDKYRERSKDKHYRN